MNTKKITVLGMLTAAALIIFIAEAQLPPLAPIPGIKLGLANIVTLVTLLYFGRREAFAVLIMRIILGSIYAGGLFGFFYSLTGGMLCFAAEAILVGVLAKNKLWVISVIGAIFHNVGQILAAVVLTNTSAVLWYLPVLIISAVITGAFNGVCAQLLLKHRIFEKKETSQKQTRY